MKKKQTDPKAKPYKLCRNISIIFFLITALCVQLDPGNETASPTMYIGLLSFFILIFSFPCYLVFKLKYLHSIKKKNGTTQPQSHGNATDANIQPSDFSSDKNDTTILRDLQSRSQDIPTHRSASSATPKKLETYGFNVAGVSFRQEDIESLGYENEDYELTKKEIIDSYLTDERIYEYEFECGKVELIPEPDNPHDPNAVKVIIDGIHVGYIKKGSCSRVKSLLASPKFKYTEAEIMGGKYKLVHEEYDGTYTLERDKTDYHIKIKIVMEA